ncbi:MAG: hypothetical protein GF401_14930 [Chitinivibrionales bacterium]|nr:hypothetical protein [Chitinivibrionales bacterium]
MNTPCSITFFGSLRTGKPSVEPDDFDAIITVLKSAGSRHELKWILRSTVSYVSEDPDGKLLEEGIRRVLRFGENVEGLEQAKASYSREVRTILRRNEIRYA